MISGFASPSEKRSRKVIKQEPNRLELITILGLNDDDDALYNRAECTHEREPACIQRESHLSLMRKSINGSGYLSK